ncbi:MULTISPECIES: acetyl-CoA decarbonylase/synthase complex subunit delta [unclassified Candidatus Frackibacter]|uniref:acetyl-CoA decarbonylase/synthase complex subunit delta n=1 Tax=unclassified Candidatus Frackibacter TaxID=2648818 RepID=UPI000881BCA1|nr:MULTISPECIES: acetyl-CoA decarbonylase/synthase complex subunit delta [unclassified Candidatus Frackibacter]SDC37850.1 acetyl-CoA decarbonylase/synthase delta subunit [Candidatus Frackibacter sp. WG11]SEM62336.1 acetyl-CoA decarbonylase/synthase delta subunit [Candidatus Frackibacter sp. WG12]SFL65533.1 acetyl-CoA decarbonylase/synthase delta subunit [Candidatus Frackibacter sp. WG13]
MAVELLKEKWSGQVNELTIGATEEDGGTRTSTVTVGGETALPYLHFEGEFPNKPVVAFEISDEEPEDMPEPLVEAWSDVWADPVDWAKKCVEEYDAELLALKLDSTNPNGQDASAEDAVETVNAVLEAVGVPLIILGCDDVEKDNEVLKAVAADTEGENLLFGIADEDNYKTLAGACMIHGHSIVAQSPVDVNICKQLNILLTDMGVKEDRIVIDPIISGLGYGMEYSYSIMERIRLGALRDDKMLSMPIINFISGEAWKAKEASTPQNEMEGWGDLSVRGPLWETLTATPLLQAGANILVVCHPKTAENIKKHVEDLMNE